MTLQDNTSLINCMQQLQLNLTRSHLSPAGCNKTTVAMMPAMSSEFVEFSHSATVKQRDLQPEHQLIKSIASLQGNWSTKLLYYLCSVSAWDETYIRTGTANNRRHFGKMESSFSPRDRLFGQAEIICQIVCKFTQQRLGLITFEKSKLEFTIKFQFWKCRSTPKFRNEFGIPFHLAFRNKLAKISSSQSHSRHLADNLILATYWRSQKIPPWLPRLTVRKGIKDGWIVGHLRYLKFNRVLLSDMKIIKEFIQEVIGVLLSRSGVLLSCWSSFVGYL